MARTFLSLAVLVAAALLLVPTAVTPVSAQAGNNSTSTPTATPYPEADSATGGINVSVTVEGFPGIDGSEDCTERVGPLVTLCESKRIDEETVALVLVHKTGGTVTVTDANKLEGDIPRQTFRISRQPTRIEMPITEDRGQVAVTIDTGRNLYGELIAEGGGSWLRNPRGTDVIAAVGVVVLIVIVTLPGVSIALDRFRGGERDVL